MQVPEQGTNATIEGLIQVRNAAATVHQQPACQLALSRPCLSSTLQLSVCFSQCNWVDIMGNCRIKAAPAFGSFWDGIRQPVRLSASPFSRPGKLLCHCMSDLWHHAIYTDGFCQIYIKVAIFGCPFN